MSHLERKVVYMEPINPTSQQVAASLKAAIETAGLSQREVATRSNIPLTTLTRHLNAGGLEWDEIRAIAKILRISAASLITDATLQAAAAA